MPRFQVLTGKHYQTERRKDKNGNEFEAEFEFDAHDATCNVVDTDRSVNGPIDLEERFNQRGFSEKFRRLPDAGTELKKFDDDAFYQEAVRRGLIKEGEQLPTSQLSINNQQAAKEVSDAAKQGAAELKKSHPALVNLDKMPLIGMQKLAEDEEIDLSQCKDEKSTREAIRKALKNR
jgi:hypothetical protein